tara:strand:+ start:181 stop:543 length:363 start_codon:yes stop_codon:yes gene_type:complete
MATINTDIAQKIDIITREDNSTTINLNITNDSGSSFDLTGYTVDFKVYHELENILSLTNGSGILNPADSTGTLDSTGKIVINISNTQMAINPGSYKHKLILTKGSSVQTWMYGKFKINND